jgi:hypothetical protein
VGVVCGTYRTHAAGERHKTSSGRITDDKSMAERLYGTQHSPPNTQTSSSYFTDNTVCLHYNDQPVNAL